MVQIKSSSAALLILAATIAPALALPAGSDTVELQEREPVRFGGAGRIMRHIRRPHGHGHGRLRGAGRAASAVQPTDDSSQQSAREFNELEEREPIRFGGAARRMGHALRPHFGGHGHGHGHGRLHGAGRAAASVQPSDDSSQQSAREYNELEEREPFGFGGAAKFLHHVHPHFGGHGHGHGHHGRHALAAAQPSGDSSQPSAREFDDEEELLAREFDDEDGLIAREFDDEEELLAREPRFGMNHVRKWNHRGGHFHPSAPSAPPADQPAAREFSDDELELMAREPEPFLGYHHLKHWIGGKLHGHRNHRPSGEAQSSAAPNSAPTEAPAARELEYDDLLERELYDDLD